ncbi:hypothetical protein NQ318_008820 [Aromia moschata]|uniref:Chitin deacetylase n=1 Tax=Aromia moschata TaxID=1265417 RepID=A0AAV8ZAN0_9CUCU|nr:hypothetical protein NQ318_008820 [Aromia moschata]
MKTVVLLSLFVTASLAVPTFGVREEGVVADACKEDVCVLKDGCRCASSKSPLETQVTPQLISLTFDEAVTADIYNNYWEPLLFDRENPDGAPIGATFFVPHEYTDYQKVNDLYNSGFEIGVHSITKEPHQSYWRGATEELLEQEFRGQKQIITKFANIPADDIIGVRTPQLQLAENVSIESYIASGLSYDSSWPTLPDHPLYPYTLDYLSAQQCLLGNKCPNEAFKGFWILPIVDLNGIEQECNTLASCNVTGTADEISDWLLKEIEKIRSTTRVPITILINSYWFNSTENSWEGLNKALDKIATYDDTFLVSQKQVFNWIKNPVPKDQFKTEDVANNANCNNYNCKLKINGDNQDRYMNACVPCPQAYPWLGNPDGDAA